MYNVLMYITNHALQRAKERLNIHNRKDLKKYINSIKKYFLNKDYIIKSNNKVLIQYINDLEHHSYKDYKIRFHKKEVFVFDGDKLVTIHNCHVCFENILLEMTKKYKKEKLNENK